MVVAILGVAASALVALLGNLFLGRVDSQAAAAASRAQESCAEAILGQRRADQGYALVTPGLCSDRPGLSVELTGPQGQSLSSCAGSTYCTVTIAAASASPVTLRLWDY